MELLADHPNVAVGVHGRLLREVEDLVSLGPIGRLEHASSSVAVTAIHRVSEP